MNNPIRGKGEVILERDELLATPLVRHAFTVLYLNNQQAPLSDPALRRAVAASIDPGAVIRAAGIRGLAGEGVIVPRTWLKSPPLEEDRPALDAATAWLAAGYSPNEEGRLARNDSELILELLTNADPARVRLAEAVATALDAIGVTVEVTPLPASDLLARRLVPRDYELALFGWEANIDPDPYLGWHTSQISETGRNIAGYQDATADALLEAARLTVDAAERRELYAAFEARFEEQAASVILAYPLAALHPPGEPRGVRTGTAVRALGSVPGGSAVEPAAPDRGGRDLALGGGCGDGHRLRSGIRREDLVDQAVFERRLCVHEPVTVEVLFDFLSACGPVRSTRNSRILSLSRFNSAA